MNDPRFTYMFANWRFERPDHQPESVYAVFLSQVAVISVTHLEVRFPAYCIDLATSLTGRCLKTLGGHLSFGYLNQSLALSLVREGLDKHVVFHAHD